MTARENADSGTLAPLEPSSPLPPTGPHHYHGHVPNVVVSMPQLQALLLALVLVPVLAVAGGLAEWQQPLLKPPGIANCGRGRKGVHMGSTFSFHVGSALRTARLPLTML